MTSSSPFQPQPFCDSTDTGGKRGDSELAYLNVKLKQTRQSMKSLHNARGGKQNPQNRLLNHMVYTKNIQTHC